MRLLHVRLSHRAKQLLRMVEQKQRFWGTYAYMEVKRSAR